MSKDEIVCHLELNFNFPKIKNYGFFGWLGVIWT